MGITGNFAAFDSMRAALKVIGKVPEGARVDAAARLQASMDAVSSAKGRALTGKARPVADGIAVSVRNASPGVGEAWTGMIEGAIVDAFVRAAK